MSTTKKTAVKVTKSDLLDALDDILTIFDFDDLPDTETATIKELAAFIEEKQDGDDCFNDEDFEIVDGRATALQIDTVATLIKAGITVPETWADRLKSVAADNKPTKKVRKSKEEEEYEEALKEAENETIEETVADIDKLDEITNGTENIVDEDKEEKTAKKSSKKDSRSEKRAARVKTYERLFKKGCDKDTVIKEILKLGTGASISTIRTEISDSKNRKYNKLSKLVVEKDGILKFEV